MWQLLNQDLIEEVDFSEVVKPVAEIENLYCAPATIDLAGAEIELVSLVAREYRLQRALNKYLDFHKEKYNKAIDYVFIVDRYLLLKFVIHVLLTLQLN